MTSSATVEPLSQERDPATYCLDRGMSPSALARSPLWLNGPDRLHSEKGLPEILDSDGGEFTVSDDCRSETKAACLLSILEDDTGTI